MSVLGGEARPGEEVSSPGELVWRLDAGDRIASVNQAWCDFARANSGEALLPPRVLGLPMREAISDPATLVFYDALLARVRGGSGPLRIRLRCDGPRAVRRIELTVHDAGDEVEFRSRIVQEEPRAEVALLDPAAPRAPGEIVTICGWCQRVPSPDGRWLEIERAVVELGLLNRPAVPRLSHGICAACSARLIAELAPDARPPGGATGRPTTAG